jgi:hypothetical protein
MSLKRRILIHGLLAAGPLAVIGYVMALLAGMWAAAQSTPRRGPVMDDTVTAAPGDDVTGLLIWKLPLFLALGGFLFVAVGEFFRWLWRPKT